mgnify:CR=1 FL=1
MTVKAYVLINVDTLLTRETLEALSRLPHVREVTELLGPYDAVAEFEVESFEQVAEILRREIRTVQGVRSTVTCVAIGSGFRGGHQG